MSTIDYRPAELGDAVAIRDVTRAAYAKWVPIIGREPLPMQADYERAVREHQFDLLVEHGRILGLIETMRRADHLWIENLAVAPEAQGRGLGRRLLAGAEEKALAGGFFEIRLSTNAAFETNVAFYRRGGFVVDREEAFAHALVVYMSKKLGSSGTPKVDRAILTIE